MMATFVLNLETFVKHNDLDEIQYYTFVQYSMATMNTVKSEFRREPARQRRNVPIEATLSVIATHGPGAVTCRAIAAEARVTQGLVRHYFASKQELIAAAFERHMSRITEATTLVAIFAVGTALDRLQTFMTASLTPFPVNPRATGIWTGFMYMSQHDYRIRYTHERAYFTHRNQHEALIANARAEAGKPLAGDELARCAIACNAVIDGVWLEGRVLPGSFSKIELLQIWLAAIGAILDLDLGAKY